MMLVLILNAITNWATPPPPPPPPIQGFDRWEPAALFRIDEVFGDRWLNDGPNRDKLGVKNTGSVLIRSYLEFDLDSLPEDFERITLNILIGNDDPGPPIEVVEFFLYEGDGVADIEDWDIGTLLWVFDHPYDEAEKFRLRLDVTDLVRAYRDGGRRYLGFRMSAPGFARFTIGKTGGIHEPNPFLAIHHAEARTDLADFTDSTDIWPFATCMVGPDDVFTSGCLLQWDYNLDDRLDLADFAIFQCMFDE
jgi:hypothetical protein